MSQHTVLMGGRAAGIARRAMQVVMALAAAAMLMAGVRPALAAQQIPELAPIEVAQGTADLPISLKGLRGAHSVRATVRVTTADPVNPFSVGSFSFSDEMTKLATVRDAQVQSEGNTDVSIVVSSGDQALDDEGVVTLGTVHLLGDAKDAEVTVSITDLQVLDERYGTLAEGSTEDTLPKPQVLNVNVTSNNDQEEGGQQPDPDPNPNPGPNDPDAGGNGDSSSKDNASKSQQSGKVSATGAAVTAVVAVAAFLALLGGSVMLTKRRG